MLDKDPLIAWKKKMCSLTYFDIITNDCWSIDGTLIQINNGKGLNDDGLCDGCPYAVNNKNPWGKLDA